MFASNQGLILDIIDGLINIQKDLTDIINCTYDQKAVSLLVN